LEFDTEEAFYAALNLPCIPPELREGTDEIEKAKAGKLPNLLKPNDIKGDLHVHTSYDLLPSHDLGKNTYEEMIEKAVELGYEYIGFAEHNPKTSGLSEDEIVEIMRKRRYEFDSLMNEKQFPLKTFLGLEVDIQPNGMLALPEKAYEYVDYVIASVHSVFTLPVEEMTDRVIRALAHPKVKILGHPTGRLINRRTGFDLDWDTIFSFVSKHNIALEINAHPSRLDLPDTLVREGLAYGVKYIINTDSHAVDQMDLMEYGVSVARRGWCEKNDIINTKEYNNVREWLL
jgi:DNA polymerase (family 10)